MKENSKKGEKSQLKIKKRSLKRPRALKNYRKDGKRIGMEIGSEVIGQSLTSKVFLLLFSFSSATGWGFEALPKLHSRGKEKITKDV